MSSLQFEFDNEMQVTGGDRTAAANRLRARRGFRALARRDHVHEFHYPPGTVLGRGERIMVCAICGHEESDGIDGDA